MSYSRRRAGILVAASGVAPEMRYAAEGFAKAGNLCGFLTPGQFGADWWGYQEWVPRGLRGYLERRQTAMPDRLIGRQLRMLEAVFTVTRASKSRSSRLEMASERLMWARNDAFDRYVAAYVERARPEFVLLSTTASARSLETCLELGIPASLSHPLVHHRWLIDFFKAESERNPQYAATLQWPSLDPDRLSLLDREIAAASGLICMSSFAASTFAAEGYQGHLAVVPPGVDTKVFRPAGGRQTRGPFRAIFVGQITQRKGLSYLLDAWRASSLPPGAELLLVGLPHGNALDLLRSAPPSVKYVPHLQRSELPALYGQSDVFLMPSLAEGFCLTALEAMACGLPVVVSEHTFGADLISQGVDGIVIPASDVESLKEAVEMLATHSALRRRIGANAALTAQAYTWEGYQHRLANQLTPVVP